MSYAIQVNSETNRIEHATFAKYVNPSNADWYILVEALPTEETDKDKDITNYLYINDEYIYDPKPVVESEETPSQLDVIEAQITYTAMMTDTLLEE